MIDPESVNWFQCGLTWFEFEFSLDLFNQRQIHSLHYLILQLKIKRPS
jgi:hypothetical protein